MYRAKPELATRRALEVEQEAAFRVLDALVPHHLNLAAALLERYIALHRYGAVRVEELLHLRKHGRFQLVGAPGVVSAKALVVAALALVIPIDALDAVAVLASPRLPARYAHHLVLAVGAERESRQQERLRVHRAGRGTARLGLVLRLPEHLGADDCLVYLGQAKPEAVVGAGVCGVLEYVADGHHVPASAAPRNDVSLVQVLRDEAKPKPFVDVLFVYQLYRAGFMLHDFESAVAAVAIAEGRLAETLAHHGALSHGVLDALAAVLGHAAGAQRVEGVLKRVRQVVVLAYHLASGGLDFDDGSHRIFEVVSEVRRVRHDDKVVALRGYDMLEHATVLGELAGIAAFAVGVFIGGTRLAGGVTEQGDGLVQVALAVFRESLLAVLGRFVLFVIG